MNSWRCIALSLAIQSGGIGCDKSCSHQLTRWNLEEVVVSKPSNTA